MRTRLVGTKILAPDRLVTVSGSLRGAVRVLSAHTFVFFACAFALVACTQDPCSEALQKLDDCGISAGRDTDEDEACEGRAACTAECINDVDCEDIVLTTADGVYARCVTSCDSAVVQ